MKKENDNSNLDLVGAICCALGYDEDCYYIKIFRDFKNNYMKKRKEYSSLLERYDTFDPMISRHIEHDRETATRMLNYILKTIQCIQDKDYDTAICVYNIMFDCLIKKYNLNTQVSNERDEKKTSKSKARRLVQNVAHS